MEIPYLSFRGMHSGLREEIIKAFEGFYDNNWFVSGPAVENFENKYAEFHSIDYSVGVSNGLDALQLALISAGIGMGDEVIVPSNTYIATVLAVSYVGATPVFAEPDIRTYNIDPLRIKQLVSAKTKAIIPVHLYGQPCKMDEIMQIANENNLIVIEDNAQSHGALYNHKMTGTFGLINATSFYPGKNLGALGEAGALTTNEILLAEKCKHLRNYGSEKKYLNSEKGFNMRMDEFQATILSIKLKKLKEWIKARNQIADFYNEELKNTGDLILPFTDEMATHVYHIYLIRTRFRDPLEQFLRENGVGTMIHYPVPVHLQNAYKELGLVKGDLPIAEEISSTCLSLPVWPGLTHAEILSVCNKIKLFFSTIGSK